MAAQPRLAGKTPDPFQGESSLCDAFLRNCQIYFDLNATHFPDDLRKVLTAFTWLDVKVPKIRRWRDQRQDDAATQAGNPPAPKGYGTWEEFKKDLALNFGAHMALDAARIAIESHVHERGTPLSRWNDTFQMMFTATKYDQEWGLHQINKMVQGHVIDEYDRRGNAAPTDVKKYMEDLVKIDQLLTKRAAERGAQRGQAPPKAFTEEINYWRDVAPRSSTHTPYHDPNAMDIDRFDAPRGQGRGFTPGRGTGRPPPVVGRPSISKEEFERRKQGNLCFSCGKTSCSSRYHNWPDYPSGPITYHATPRIPANTRAFDTEEQDQNDEVTSRQVRFASDPNVTIAPASPEPGSPRPASQKPTLINRLSTIDSEACDIWSETMTEALKDPDF